MTGLADIGPLAKILFFGINHPWGTDIRSGTPSPPNTGTGGTIDRGRGLSGPASGPTCLPVSVISGPNL